MMIECCNMCGKQMSVWDREQDISIRKQMGYASKHDGEYLALDLCSECIDKVIDELSAKCKIPIMYGSKKAYKIKEVISKYEQHKRMKKTN